jgi:hypothetical protein
MKAITAATSPTGMPVSRASGSVLGKIRADRTQIKKKAMYATTNVATAITNDFANHPFIAAMLSRSEQPYKPFNAQYMRYQS